jgi:hypothetical protein
LKSRVDKLHEFADKKQRDPASIGIAYVWFYPVTFDAVPGFDTVRRMFSGNPADTAALKEVGVSHISLGFIASTTAEMQDAMQRFSEDVMPLA